MNLQDLIKNGESNTVELKEKFNKQTIESAVAFVNWKVSIHREQKKLKKAQYIVNTHLSF